MGFYRSAPKSFLLVDLFCVTCSIYSNAFPHLHPHAMRSLSPTARRWWMTLLPQWSRVVLINPARQKTIIHMRLLVQCPAHIDRHSENPTRPSCDNENPLQQRESLATVRIPSNSENPARPRDSENSTHPYDSENPPISENPMCTHDSENTSIHRKQRHQALTADGVLHHDPRLEYQTTKTQHISRRPKISFLGHRTTR